MNHFLIACAAIAIFEFIVIEVIDAWHFHSIYKCKNTDEMMRLRWIKRKFVGSSLTISLLLILMAYIVFIRGGV